MIKGLPVNIDYKIQYSISGLDELKATLEKVKSDVTELETSLSELDNCKLQVSLHPVKKEVLHEPMHNTTNQA